ncbi:MAG: CoB--CoM heterodisulfide reductase iron-sulfur subunit A family protein [Spirochaetales bacterium]|nr:CoB--CoM heterodisulfide reductase iron-sulfur subunit A family protein [Spirochaetales bacterium]
MENSTDNKSEKTILFLCKCGTNIAGSIDFDRIKKWVKSYGGIDIIATGNLLCSPKEKEKFSQILRTKKPDQVIIAACTPKLHEKTFQELAEKEGVNPGRIRFANIREQCAWVVKDREKATEKAIHLIRAAIRRSRFSEDLFRKTMKVNTDILIIGGGIAGIQAARALARSGRKVYLVEREISIGGFLIKCEEVAPNMECAPCMLSPLLAEIRDSASIEVFAPAMVEEVVGFFGNFKARIRQRARYVENTCMACEECFEVCPVSVTSKYHHNLGNRKAVYTLFAGSVPGAAAIDRNACLHFKDGSCDACVAACPYQSINFEQEDSVKEVEVGAVIVATGFSSPDLSAYPELGYGAVENVLSTGDFERLASTNGPTEGEIKLKSGETPGSAVVIHCAGSLMQEGLPYCSTTCCTAALKVGELLRKQNSEARVVNIHGDLVFNKPGEQKFFEKQKEEGTIFIRSQDLKAIKITTADSGKILVEGKDFDRIESDMVVLASGMKPAKGTGALSELLNLSLDDLGYIVYDHEVLQQTRSSLDGIYLAGCALMTCNASTAVTQSVSASGDIMSRLVPGNEIELEMMTAVIDPELCSGCKLCISVCPFKAIVYNKEKKVSEVMEAICRGCGTCSAACPNGASTARNFTNHQILAEIGGLLK